METCGYLYTPQPQNPPPGMMYMKGYTLRGFERQTYHLHVRYPGDWDELYFHDYLCINVKAAARYAAEAGIFRRKGPPHRPEAPAQR